jgi:hypothetical protein
MTLLVKVHYNCYEGSSLAWNTSPSHGLCSIEGSSLAWNTSPSHGLCSI